MRDPDFRNAGTGQALATPRSDPPPAAAAPAGDLLHRAAVEIAVDVTALLLEHRDRVGTDDAVRFAADTVRISDHVAAARRAADAATRRNGLVGALDAARMASHRLSVLAERSRLPLLRTADVHRRIRALARALEALAAPPPRG